MLPYLSYTFVVIVKIYQAMQRLDYRYEYETMLTLSALFSCLGHKNVEIASKINQTMKMKLSSNETKLNKTIVKTRNKWTHTRRLVSVWLIL